MISNGVNVGLRWDRNEPIHFKLVMMTDTAKLCSVVTLTAIKGEESHNTHNQSFVKFLVIPDMIQCAFEAIGLLELIVL